jgi:ethanolamine utilization protein EutN
MLIAKVVGNIWATKKDERLEGYKLLVTKLKSGELVVAVDTIGAGIGEDVLLVRGRQTAGILREEKTPADAAIVGIIDSVEVDDSLLK